MDIIVNINEAGHMQPWVLTWGLLFISIGGAGLAIGGTAYGIGLVAFAGTGAVAGFAVYGTKKSELG